MNKKKRNIFAIASLALGILNFLSISMIIIGFFMITSWAGIAFFFLLILNRTLFWFWPILLGIIALKMKANDERKTPIRKLAVSGIVLGIIAGIAEILMFFWLIMVIKIYGF